jgi:hypothetical protein
MNIRDNKVVNITVIINVGQCISLPIYPFYYFLGCDEEALLACLVTFCLPFFPDAARIAIKAIRIATIITPMMMLIAVIPVFAVFSAIGATTAMFSGVANCKAANVAGSAM